MDYSDCKKHEWKQEMHTKFWLENLKENYHLRDVGVHGWGGG